MNALYSQALSAIVLLLVLGLSALPAAGRTAQPLPQKNYRIGYFQIGPYWTFDLTFKAFQKGLDRRGWGDKITFVQDAHYNPGWDAPAQEIKRIAQEIMARTDLDLIVVMGTKTTRALLAANNHRTPILGMDMTDPVKAGLVKGPQDSGTANFTTLLDLHAWEDLFTFFHESVHFKRLGLVVIDTPDGYIFSHLATARKVARDRGFELLLYKDVKDDTDIDACQQGIKTLVAQGIDAFFIPEYICFDLHHNKDQTWIDRLTRKKIPTFASEGSQMIKQGVLMGQSSTRIDAMGDLYADMAIKILQGTPPDQLPMEHHYPPSIALNLQVAQKIGIQFPFQLLSIFDEIFLETER